MSDELWAQLRKLTDRIGIAERDLAEHLGECKARHAEIQRRFEEANRSRGELRADNARDAASLRSEIDKAHSKVDQVKNRITGLAITIAMATLAIIAQIILQNIKLLH